jgi:hypothetical protein
MIFLRKYEVSTGTSEHVLLIEELEKGKQEGRLVERDESVRTP